MDYFRHKDGRLWCEDVPLDRLAEEVGTPAYVYSRRTIVEHVAKLQTAFAALDPLVCFALKANGNLAVLDLVRRAGAGFDVVSGGELRRVLSVGAKPSTIVFAGVGKTVAEMEAALRARILGFNVESEEEVEVLAAVAARLGVRGGRPDPPQPRRRPEDPHLHLDGQEGVEVRRRHRARRGARAPRPRAPLPRAARAPVPHRLPDHDRRALRGVPREDRRAGRPPAAVGAFAPPRRHGRRVRHLLQGRVGAPDRGVREGRHADPARARAIA